LEIQPALYHSKRVAGITQEFTELGPEG